MTKERTMYQLPNFLKFGMIISEILIINLIFYYFYKGILCPGSEHPFDISFQFGFMATLLTISYVIGIELRPISFFYRSDRRGSILSNVFATVIMMSVVFWIFALVFGFNNKFQSIRIIYVLVSIYVSLALWRYLCRWIIRWFRTRGRNLHHVIFVGNNEPIRELGEEMRHPFYGYRVEGYFADEPMDPAPAELTYLGKVSEAVDYVKEHTYLQHLYCSLPAVRANEILEIIDACERNCVRFYAIPQLRTYLKRKMQLEILGSIPVLSIRDNPLDMLTNRIIKRTFDIVVSAIFMIPFWLLIYPVIAILTHYLQPGPVFFKQKRNGLNGKEFVCYKFRSMKVNAEADVLQATENDPRKTKFGDFMRRMSIDELPQFINVLKGDMSIVGPRPHMVKHTEEYSKLIDKYMVRHWVLPGITGWAQVNGARGETKELWQMEDRIKKDVWYVENWSFSLDLKIIFKTVWNVIKKDKQAF